MIWIIYPNYILDNNNISLLKSLANKCKLLIVINWSKLTISLMGLPCHNPYLLPDNLVIPYVIRLDTHNLTLENSLQSISSKTFTLIQLYLSYRI